MKYLTSLALALLAGIAGAQDVQYISDKQFIPVRSGPGNQYRIVNRGLPSGTRLTVKQVSDDGAYSEITTDRGTTGWVRSQYLMAEQPAALQLGAAQRTAEDLRQRNNELQSRMEQLASDRDAQIAGLESDRDDQIAALTEQRSQLEEQLASTAGDLNRVSDELSQLQQISGNAVQLDTDNRRLVEQSEMLKSDVETLEAENQRLQDKLDSEAFMNGALAVLLGVVITLAVPRLWPKRRSSSSWA